MLKLHSVFDKSGLKLKDFADKVAAHMPRFKASNSQEGLIRTCRRYVGIAEILKSVCMNSGACVLP